MMTKNPKFQFYKLMHQFLTAPEFIELLAKEVMRLWDEHNDVLTLEEFSVEDLVLEHENQHEMEYPTASDFVNDLLLALSRDLFPQLRNPEVQDLVNKYRWFSTHDNVLLAHARRIKPMGESGAATITLVVNDWRLFLLAMDEKIPEDMWRSLIDGDAPDNLDYTLMSWTKPA